MGAQSHSASINLCRHLDNVTHTCPSSRHSLMGVGGFESAAIIHSIYGYPMGAAVLSPRVERGIDLTFTNTSIYSAIHRLSLQVHHSSACVCSPLPAWIKERAAKKKKSFNILITLSLWLARNTHVHTPSIRLIRRTAPAARHH